MIRFGFEEEAETKMEDVRGPGSTVLAGYVCSAAIWGMSVSGLAIAGRSARGRQRRSSVCVF